MTALGNKVKSGFGKKMSKFAENFKTGCQNC